MVGYRSQEEFLIVQGKNKKSRLRREIPLEYEKKSIRPDLGKADWPACLFTLEYVKKVWEIR